MPTSPKTRKALLALAPLSIEGDIFELGSGWGSLLFPLAEKYLHNRLIGYEKSPVPFLFSRIRLKCKKDSHVMILAQDFFRADLQTAGLIVCYLYPGAMEKLKPKFEKELKKGTWILSNTFAIPGWTPTSAKQLDDLYGTWIYLYRV